MVQELKPVIDPKHTAKSFIKILFLSRYIVNISNALNTA